MAATTKGFRYPVGTDVPDVPLWNSNLANDVDGKFPACGSFTGTTDANGNLAITHTLGRVPTFWMAWMQASATTASAPATSPAPTGTAFTCVFWNSSTLARVATTAITVRWIAM